MRLQGRRRSDRELRGRGLRLKSTKNENQRIRERKKTMSLMKVKEGKEDQGEVGPWWEPGEIGAVTSNFNDCDEKSKLTNWNWKMRKTAVVMTLRESTSNAIWERQRKTAPKTPALSLRETKRPPRKPKSSDILTIGRRTDLYLPDDSIWRF